MVAWPIMDSSLGGILSPRAIRDDGTSMRLTRTIGLAATLMLIAVGIVFLRAEQTRLAKATLALESEWVHLRGERWALQAQVARLRTPAQTRGRMAIFGVALDPPRPASPRRPSSHLALVP